MGQMTILDFGLCLGNTHVGLHGKDSRKSLSKRSLKSGWMGSPLIFSRNTRPHLAALAMTFITTHSLFNTCTNVPRTLTINGRHNLGSLALEFGDTVAASKMRLRGSSPERDSQREQDMVESWPARRRKEPNRGQRDPSPSGARGGRGLSIQVETGLMGQKMCP